MRLAELLAGRGDLDELRARADAGDRYAAERLADLLADRGDLDEAEQILRARANAGDEYAAVRLAGLLVDRGDLDEAEQILRARADANEDAAERLADLLADRGDLDELRARANAGEITPPNCWPTAATRTGPSRSCAPGPTPTRMLPGGWPDAGPARRPGRVARPNAGEWYVVRELADLLAQRETGRVARPGERRRQIRRLAVGQARRSGRGEQILRARVNAGDEDAAVRLAGLLADRGHLDEAEQILRARADAGDWRAAGPLADLLIKQGRSEEAERLRRFGLNPDGSIARA